MIHSDLQQVLPFQYFCPITRCIMIDPVTTVDGHTFQRQAIQNWFNTGHHTNPLTNSILASTAVIPNRSLKILISQCVGLAAGDSLEKLLSTKAKKFILQLNEEFKVKFPNLINSVGVVDVKKIQKIVKMNDKFSIENETLRTELNDMKKQFQYHLPTFYKNGTLNCGLLAKIVKNEQKLKQRIQQLNQTIDELREQISTLESQKNLAISLMTASLSPQKLQTINITQSWYDQAAKALQDITLPAEDLVIHITESNNEDKVRSTIIYIKHVLISL